MYFENSGNARRERWTYQYFGEELAPYARELVAWYKEYELHAREQVAQLLRDPTVSHNDERIVTYKKDIERFGREHEACKVYLHQFTEAPTLVYRLHISDIVYFRIVK